MSPAYKDGKRGGRGGKRKGRGTIGPGRGSSQGGGGDPPDLRLVPSGSSPRVGEVIRALRKRPRPRYPKGLTITEAALRTEACPDGTVTVRTWSRVEHGHVHPKASYLMCMALAIEATPVQIRELFHLAGYGLLFDTLAGAGAGGSRRPRPAEAGILADPRLPHDKRQMLLDHLRDIVDAAEARARRQEEEDETDDPDDHD